MSEQSFFRGNIDNIRSAVSSVARYRQASPARYEIAFSHPGDFGQSSGGGGRNPIGARLNSSTIQKRLSDSCEIVSLPGRGHSSQANTIYGPVREMPYQTLYSGDLDITFRVGSDYLERHYFETWSDLMINRRTHNYNYYDTYASVLVVRALSKADELLYEAQVKECYPKNVGAIEYGYEKVDELTKFTVSLSFRDYEVTYYSPITTEAPPPALPPNVGGPGGAPSYGGPNDPDNQNFRYA